MRSKKPNLKAALRSTTALAGLLGLALTIPTPARANCDNLAPTTGQTVTCGTTGGTETSPMVAGNAVTDVSVIMDSGASMNIGQNNALNFGDNNARHAVTLHGTASITTIGPPPVKIDLGGGLFNWDFTNAPINFGVNNTGHAVRLKDTASIITSADYSQGVAFSDGATENTVEINDASSISVTGDYASGVLFSTGSIRNNVALNSTASISTVGRDGQGVKFASDATDNTVTVTQSATISTTGSISAGIGILSGAERNHIVLDNSAVITTTGIVSAGVVFYSNSSGSETKNNSVTMNASSSIETFGDNSWGIAFGSDNDGNVITLNDNASMWTRSSGSHGIKFFHDATADQIFNTSSRNTVALNSSFVLRTDGDGADGIVIGDGIDNTINLKDNSSISVAGDGSAAIRFYQESSNNVVNFSGASAILTAGGSSPGVVFDNLGSGNNITLAAGTSISTTGANSPSILDGDGSLTIVSAGLLSSASGVAVDLGDGDDSLTLQDGAQVVGTLDGGNGTDTLRLEGSTGFLGINYVNFENLTVEAVISDGEWNVTTDLVLTGASNVNQGLLSVNANFTAPTVMVASGGSLGGTGTINSAVTIGGMLAPGNSVGTLNVIGAVNFAAGGSFDAEVDRTGMDLLAVAGAPGTVTIAPATTVNVIHLDRAEGHAGSIVTATGGIAGSFGTLVRGSSSVAATLVQTANAIRLVTAAPSVFSSQVWAGSEEGFAFLDMVIDEAGTSRANPKRRAWSSFLYRNAERSGSQGFQSYDQNIVGAAFGTYMYRNGPVRIGAAVGYTGCEVELGSATGEGDFDSVHGGLYGSYVRGKYFLDGTLTGGYQTGDSERIVIVDGATQRAKGDSDAFLVGSSIRTGWVLPMGGGWSARPSASFSYMHRHQESYSERGGGDAAVALDSENSDAARMNWQLQVARASTVTLKGKAITLRPSARVGLMHEWTLDDRDITGRFQANGAAFSLHMDARDETMVTFGAGIEAALGDWTAFVAYNGAASKITDRNSVTMGLRKAW